MPYNVYTDDRGVLRSSINVIPMDLTLHKRMNVLHMGFDIKEVRGDVVIIDCPVQSLGSLGSVHGTLYMEGTSLDSLGVLREVGQYINTGGGYWELGDLRGFIQEIEDSSISTLVERLPIEKDPFLKRVIERRLHG